MSEERPIISRADAIAANLPRYFTGLGCRNGHMSERYTSDGKCVACRNGSYFRNRDQQLEQRRQHYSDNRQKAAKANKVWREANPDHRRAYVEANREMIREIDRRSYRANAEQRREEKRKYRERFPARIHRRRCEYGTFTREDIRRLLAAQKGRCPYCRSDIRGNFHIDHILPISKGGLNNPANLQLTCGPCNQRKGAKLPEDFARELGLLL